MKTLSIRQPWPTHIESGRKRFEIRKWFTHYRGPVLIVSGAREWKGENGERGPGPLGPTSSTVCVVDLVDCRPATAADAEGAMVAPPAGSFVWELKNPRTVKRVPVKGKLGLYDAPAELLAALGIEAQPQPPRAKRRRGKSR